MPIDSVRERPERTAQGYRRFRCLDCTKQFNELSTGLLNRAQYPSDVIALVVVWRLRYKLSLRDLAEMFLIRGIVFSYEAVRDWDAKLTPALAEDLRSRKGKVGRSWYVDETYKWCFKRRSTLVAPGGSARLAGLRRASTRRRPEVQEVPLSRDRSRWRPRGRHAQRAPQPGRGQALPSIGKGGHRCDSGPGHDGRPRRLSAGDPDGTRRARAASDQLPPEQPPRAGSPRH